MRAQRIGTCEVKIGAEGWRSIDVADVKALAKPVLRCPACHGSGWVSGHYATKERYRFAHARFHAGCRLSGEFNGIPSLHPQALA